MNKIKKIWVENRVLVVLAIILVICLIIIGIVALKSFYNGSDNVYGNRLDITKKIPLSDETINEVAQKIKENEKVSDVSALKKGKVVYITIVYLDDTKIEDAKSIAADSVNLFSEEILSVYDLEYIIKTTKKDGFVLTGAKNSRGSESIVWTNQNMSQETDEGSKK